MVGRSAAQRPTFMAMNLSTRYWVKTEMTTSPSVCGSRSISGNRRACVLMRNRQASYRGRKGWTESKGGGGTLISFSTPTPVSTEPKDCCKTGLTPNVVQPDLLHIWNGALPAGCLVVVLNQMDDVLNREHACEVSVDLTALQPPAYPQTWPSRCSREAQTRHLTH